jgi:hypothetical protein
MVRAFKIGTRLSPFISWGNTETNCGLLHLIVISRVDFEILDVTEVVFCVISCGPLCSDVGVAVSVVHVGQDGVHPARVQNPQGVGLSPRGWDSEIAQKSWHCRNYWHGKLLSMLWSTFWTFQKFFDSTIFVEENAFSEFFSKKLLSKGRL